MAGLWRTISFVEEDGTETTIEVPVGSLSTVFLSAKEVGLVPTV